MLFGVRIPEKIWHAYTFADPYLYTVTTLPWEIQKSHL